MKRTLNHKEIKVICEKAQDFYIRDEVSILDRNAFRKALKECAESSVPLSVFKQVYDALQKHMDTPKDEQDSSFWDTSYAALESSLPYLPKP